MVRWQFLAPFVRPQPSLLKHVCGYVGMAMCGHGHVLCIPCVYSFVV